MVTAKGKKNGSAMTVRCENQDGILVFTFNEAEDLEKEAEIDILLREPRPILGGTYWPECEALKIASVLPYFFDPGGLEQLDVDDPEAEKELSEIKFEEGEVY